MWLYEKHRYGHLFILLILRLSYSPDFVDATLSTDGVKRIRDFVNHVLRCQNIPGLSMTVVEDQRTVVADGFGKADLENNIEATNRTMFCIASLTKAFTSTLLVKLLDDDDRYNLDTPIAKILGDCCQFIDDYLSEHVTVRDLLLHRTGIPRYDDVWFFNESPFDSIMRRIKFMRQKVQFRARAIYNNNMYALAGRVAEKLGGKSWECLVKDHLLNPLGMHSTTFMGRPLMDDQQMAEQYMFWDKKQHKLGRITFSGASSIGPAISVCTTADDMAKWIRFHLSKGRNESGRTVVKESSLSETYQPQVHAGIDMLETYHIQPTTPVTDSHDSYGLAWFLGYYRGYPTIKHHGSFPGFYSLITLVPSIRLGVFVSVNGVNNRPFAINSLIHNFVVDTSLGIDPWINKTTACTYPMPWVADDLFYITTAGVNMSIRPHRSLVEYTGTYVHRVYGTLTVVLTEQHTLKLVYGKLQMTLYPYEKDTLFGVPDDKGWVLRPQEVDFKLITRPKNEKVEFKVIIKFFGPYSQMVFVPYTSNWKHTTANQDKVLCAAPTSMVAANTLGIVACVTALILLGCPRLY